MKKPLLFHEWVTRRKSRVRRTSLKTYRSYENAHILPFFGQTPIGEITPKRLKAFRHHLSKKHLAAKTRRDILSHMDKILTDAARKGHCKKPKRQRVPVNAREKEVLSGGEQAVLSEHLKHSSAPEDNAILLALATGLRLGEVTGLRIKDIDLKTGVLRVRKNRQRVYDPATGRSPLAALPPKTRAGLRDIPLHSALVRALSRYLSGRSGSARDMPLFTNRTGQPVDPRSLQYRFGRIKKELNLNPALTFHSLRHSFATRALENGMDMNTLSELLGHTSVAFTLTRYGHSVTSHKRRQMEKMAASM